MYTSNLVIIRNINSLGSSLLYAVLSAAHQDIAIDQLLIMAAHDKDRVKSASFRAIAHLLAQMRDKTFNNQFKDILKR
jgi:hypothetical protein